MYIGPLTTGEPHPVKPTLRSRTAVCSPRNTPPAACVNTPTSASCFTMPEHKTWTPSSAHQHISFLVGLRGDLYQGDGRHLSHLPATSIQSAYTMYVQYIRGHAYLLIVCTCEWSQATVESHLPSSRILFVAPRSISTLPATVQRRYDSLRFQGSEAGCHMYHSSLARSRNGTRQTLLKYIICTCCRRQRQSSIKGCSDVTLGPYFCGFDFRTHQWRGLFGPHLRLIFSTKYLQSPDSVQLVRRFDVRCQGQVSLLLHTSIGHRRHGKARRSASIAHWLRSQTVRHLKPAGRRPLCRTGCVSILFNFCIFCIFWGGRTGCSCRNVVHEQLGYLSFRPFTLGSRYSDAPGASSTRASRKHNLPDKPLGRPESLFINTCRYI